MASLYRPSPSNTFRCLDSSREVPWNHVNDDYCDCQDGSDEPGTSACTNGKFHCTNAGHQPLNILSSRVNDGVCDCCDGTDEWEKRIECVNNCKELGKAAREERDRVKQLQEQGYKTKLTYIEEGRKNREEKRNELEQLEKERIEIEAVKVEMEGKKNEAEGPEKEAKEKHENWWKEEQEQRKAQKEQLRAMIAFRELDTNYDDKVDVHEIKAHSQFDIDSNGEVTDEEAKEHLETDAEFTEMEHFLEKVWPHIKDFYKSPETKEDTKGDNKDKTEDTEPVKGPPAPTISDTDDDDHDDEYDDEEHESDDEFRDEEDHEEEKKKEEEEEEKMPDYNEETKALIAAADEARNQFNDADGKLKDIDNRIKSVKSYLDLDYGPEEEFSALKGNCYEYTDREYTYKLCAFDRASQRSKHGGSETTLGNWGRWEGPDNDKYAAQKYENGQNCWNGPNRSVKVNMRCGTENKLTNAFEPNRCVYEFDFLTPARCTHSVPEGQEDMHDEL